MSEHQGILTEGAASLATDLGFYVCSEGWTGKLWINCVEEEDARTFNQFCYEKKVAPPHWIPPLREPHKEPA